MAYARASKALGQCDRCGFSYRLNTLQYEIEDGKRNGLRVCSECFDVDQPQLKLGEVNTSDNQALFDARVDTGREASTSYFGSNTLSSQALTGSIGIITTSNADNSPDSITTSITGVVGTKSLGSLTVAGASSFTSYTVTVATGTNSYGTGNKFYLNGSVSPTLSLTEGEIYRFDQSDSTNGTHPLRFSTTANGTHAGGSEYTTGVTTNGTPGSSGAYTQIEIASGAPTLYYYCTNHSGMGGQINT